MRWEDLPESQNVEDRRGGGGGGFPGGAGGMSIGAILILGIIGYATGIDPRLLIGAFDGSSQPRVEQTQPGAQPKDETGRFVNRILGSTETTWKDIFAKSGRTYRPPVLVLFSDQTQTKCGGQALSAMGPFYCPADKRIYLDTTFFRLIETRFKSCDVGSQSCRFAQAYVIAHEVAHHVQNELGILTKVHARQREFGAKTPEANRIQVQVELQADCFAGVWANRNESRLQSGDIDAALKTASAIGDDALQRSAGRAVVPDSFTHGTSAQRRRWFESGYKQGTVQSCNTFTPTAQL